MSNNEILQEFLLETHENLALLDSDLVALEKNPTETSTLAQVFRTLHSVKGTAGFMGLVKLQAVSHSAESLLSRLRAGELRFNPPIATALLAVVDAIREMLASIEKSGDEGLGDYTVVIAEVDRLRAASADQAAESLPAESLPAESTPLAEAPSQDSESIRAPAAASLQISPPMSDLARDDVQESRSINVADTNIRVDVGLLDKLMTLVGELVLARNQILQYSDAHEDSDSHEDSGYLGAVQRLNRLTTELQASVMKTRMQPIGNVLNKFPRVVRDLALSCGKSVRFEMEGQDTELDKTLLEAIRDPLTHMVRNAIDHGIETAAVRKLRGKPEEGKLRMLAFHEGGKVIIEITDDGAGIDVDRVKDKAIGAKLVSPEMALRLSQQELLRLILLPGFSTAEQVTQFSGRGVGMDVVRTNIEKIGGTVDIESTLGQGTTIRTIIPLTLAIIPALIIVSGGDRYAIPQVSLLELLRLDPEQALRGIERIHDATFYRLRGALLPLVFLADQFQFETLRTSTDDLNIVVLQADDRPFGLVVDAVRDTEEIVVKPLQKQLKGIMVFAGAAIMGDGRAALVLDVLGLAQRANVITGAKRHTVCDHEQTALEPASAAEPLLLFAPTAGGQMAIPLALVSRLEEFPRTMLENLGTSQVVQYRGEILPLIELSQKLEQLQHGVSIGRPTAIDDAALPVIVYSAGEQRVGLIVGKIHDIVHKHIATRSRANRPGVLYTAIVQDRVTEFIDVEALVRETNADPLPIAT